MSKEEASKLLESLGDGPDTFSVEVEWMPYEKKFLVTYCDGQTFTTDTAKGVYGMGWCLGYDYRKAKETKEAIAYLERE